MAVYNWVDITDGFVEASQKLDLGELFHDKNFGLLEAMSAIEMMDPKMDAGMMCNQVHRKVLSLQQAIQDDVLKLDGFTIAEQIGIMDSTLACLVTWLEGHSLAQTLFTNLYLHDPYIIEDRCMKAFSICMLKICDLLRDRVNRAGVFEEEDFQPMSYGFKMAGDVSDMRVTGMLKEVEDDLNRHIKSTRIREGEERDATTQNEHEQCLAMYNRVRFYRLLFVLFVNLSKEKCEGIGQADKVIDQLLDLALVIRSTVDKGILPEDREITKNDYPTIMGFEPLLNQRLLPPTFPRYTKITSRDESYDYMASMLRHLKIVCSVTSHTSFHTLLETFHEFSKQEPSIVSRSLLQLSLFSPTKRVFGTYAITDYVKDTIRVFIAPPSLNPKCALYNHSQAKEYVDTFATHAARVMSALFQITGHNRARQRDKWGHVLDDLTALQDEADKVDSFLHQLLTKVEPSRQHLACFGTWVLYHTLHVMIDYILSGFELELYAMYEYHYMFWYLYELLYVWLTSSLSRAETFLTENDSVSDQSQKGRNPRKNKKKRRPKSNSRELTIAQAMQQLCGGYYKAIVGFLMDGRMKATNFLYKSDEVRYTHRFSPFASVITPPLMHYSQYKEMTDCKQYRLVEDVYTCACKYFHQARSLFETITNPSQEIQNLTTVAKTNFVVIKLLLGGHRKDSTQCPEFEFNLHKAFPVIKVP